VLEDILQTFFKITLEEKFHYLQSKLCQGIIRKERLIHKKSFIVNKNSKTTSE